METTVVSPNLAEIGVAAWNQWRSANPDADPDLTLLGGYLVQP